jgi:hypothetical protein
VEIFGSLIFIIIFKLLTFSYSKESSIIFRKDKGIFIVYYTYINSKRWRAIVPNQLIDLVDSKLLSIADISLVISFDSNSINKDLLSFSEEVENTIKTILLPYNSSIKSYKSIFVNQFEFPGIELLYNYSLQHADKLCLYFHGKGMVFHRKPDSMRIPEEVFLSNTTIKQWPAIVDIFNNNLHINKVTFSCQSRSRSLKKCSC